MYLFLNLFSMFSVPYNFVNECIALLRDFLYFIAALKSEISGFDSLTIESASKAKNFENFGF